MIRWDISFDSRLGLDNPVYDKVQNVGNELLIPRSKPGNLLEIYGYRTLGKLLLVK